MATTITKKIGNDFYNNASLFWDWSGNRFVYNLGLSTDVPTTGCFMMFLRDVEFLVGTVKNFQFGYVHGFRNTNEHDCAKLVKDWKKVRPHQIEKKVIFDTGVFNTNDDRWGKDRGWIFEPLKKDAAKVPVVKADAAYFRVAGGGIPECWAWGVSSFGGQQSNIVDFGAK